MSFLDERDFKVQDLMIRSRAPTTRLYAEEILAKLQPLLRPRNVCLPAAQFRPPGDGSGDFASSLNNNNDDNNNPPLRAVKRLVADLPLQPDEASS
uniref:Uncharacterized protein n=1 Tax=Macrostomum lignano TaxID=282301 RepID=A0A1I8F5G8_9PLAT